MLNETPKSLGKRRFYVTVVAYINMAFFIIASLMSSLGFFLTLGDPSSGPDASKIFTGTAILIGGCLVACLGIVVLKMSPTIYYYDDGFAVGKNGEKVPYQGLQYHFLPGTTPNRFMQIFYKSNGEMKRLNAQAYTRYSFDDFQKDVINANLPQALKRIENGETVEFKAKNPKIFATNTARSIDKQISQGIKVKINKTSITFDDEIYNWSDYTVVSEFAGLIVVLDPETGKKVLTFSNAYMVEQPNVVTGLINIIGGR